MTARASAADRARDAIALACVVGGGALFFYAHAGMRALAANRVARRPGHMLAEEFGRYWRLSRVGMWVAIAGVAIAVGSYFYHRARRASST